MNWYDFGFGSVIIFLFFTFFWIGVYAGAKAEARSHIFGKKETDGIRGKRNNVTHKSLII